MPDQPRIIQLDSKRDERGVLYPIEEFCGQPVRRVFYITGVPVYADRAGHAHMECHQLLIAMSGSFRAHAGDREYTLVGNDAGLYVPPRNVIQLYAFAPGTVCLVVCSHGYDPDEYIFVDGVSDRMQEFAARETSLDEETELRLAGAY